jgi:hypothetical protein
VARVMVDADALNALLDAAGDNFKYHGLVGAVRTSVRSVPDEPPCMPVIHTLRKRATSTNE